MSEWLGPFSSVIASATAIVAAGTPLFLRLGIQRNAELAAQLTRRAFALILFSVSAFAAAHVSQLFVKLAQLNEVSSGYDSNATTDWLTYLWQTRPGNVWVFKFSVAVALAFSVAILLLRSNSRRAISPRTALALSFSGVLLFSSSAWSGHYSGSDEAWLYVSLHFVHMTAVALWLGSLPMWLLAVHATTNDTQLNERMTELLTSFSSIAILLVVLAIATGIPLAYQFIDSQGDLLGTRWGGLLTAKLALVAIALYAANETRLRLYRRQLLRKRALTFVGLEWILLLAVAALAAMLGQTSPASHAQPHWWLSYRFSYDAIEPDLPLVYIFWSSTAVTIAALALGAIAWRRNASRALSVTWIVIGSVAIVSASWAVTVPAYPDTFRRSDVPYMAESIASGIRLYQANCVQCHGNGGRADGPLAPFTRVPPVDLAAPHTALHTAGDLFGWIGAGMPSGAMPGFSRTLSEQDRWDIVNFLRSFSQGFQARVLDANIIRNQSWLAAPDFYLTRADKSLSQLKALRGSPSLIVVQDQCTTELDDRLDNLSAWRHKARASLEFVVACQSNGNTDKFNDDIWRAQSAPDAISTYSLLARTLEMKGSTSDLGVKHAHVEFLVDRFGYVRGRWVPDENPLGWTSTESLAAQLDLLSNETRIPPPPDSHLH